MSKLGEMKLLNNKELPMTKFPGINQSGDVYNDYHTRQTNPGYSRNKLGGMYTR
jgi:hypothetical protein